MVNPLNDRDSWRWQGCKRVAKTFVTANTIRPNERTNTLTIRPNERTNTLTIRPNERTNILENVIRDNSPIFTEKPFVRVMSRSGQLQTMIRYVQLNPARLATKRLHPGYFHVMHDVEVAGRTFDH